MQEGKRKEYTYQVMYVCIYYAINLLQKMLCTKYYHFLYKKMLHYQPIGIIEKQRNCQMWNPDVPPKPYRPP